MGRLFAVVAAILCGVIQAGAVQAQQVTAQNPASLVGALQGAGYRAVLKRGDDGDPMIESSSSGSSFVVFFFGCTKNAACKTVQFFSGYTSPKNASISSLNEWNAGHRFGRAYLADSGAARLEMDLDLDDGGMSRALFEDNVEFWVTIMANFEKHIGWTQ